MKKLGLRAVAGGLALLLTTSVFAPATPANAAEMLVVAKAPKTLVITADMVDDDGEIVISNEKWDRIIIEKEAAAMDIYFDEVEVGELIVESGNSARVQLWDVEAEKVTVQEPQLDNVELKDLAALLADEETRDETVKMFLKILERREKASNTAPTIVTMEDAKVDEVVARANAVLDFAEGKVGAVALEASAQVERANVILKNYDGELTFKGTEGKSATQLKVVNSEISKLTVEDATADNYFNVSSKESTAAEVEVASSAKVALNVPVGTLKITEDAAKASVDVLDSVDEMNVAADDAKVDIAPIGNVELATVEGDNVKIVGDGVLAEADITGKGAYVSTEGTEVEGENTYVKPVYVETPYDTWTEDFADADIHEKLNENMNGGKFTYNEEGYGVASSAKGWEGFSVTLDNKDNGSRANFVISMKVKQLGGSASQIRMTTPPGCSASYMDKADLTGDWQTITSNKIAVPAGGSVTVMVAPTDNANTLELAVDNVVVQRYTDWTEPEARPVVTEDKTFTFVNENLSDYVSYNVPVEYKADENGALVMKTDGQYQAVIFKLPEVVNAADYSKLKVFLSSTAGDVAVKVWRVGEAGSGGNPATVNYSAVSNPEIDLSGIFGDDIEKVEFATMSSSAATITVEKIVFVAAGASGGSGSEDDDQDPTPAPEVDLTGATKCETDKYQVHHFKDYNLVEYAGQPVSFSVDMVRIGGSASEAIVAQDSAYSAMYVATEIGETWKTYTYSITVPKDYASKDTAYLGFRWKTNPVNDYADYAFYFKNFKFEGTKAEVKPTTTPAPEVTPDVEKEDSVTITAPAVDTLKVGESITLTATPSDTEGTVTWETSDATVATVENGKVTGKKAGEVTITAKYGTAKAEVKLTVEDYVTITTTATTVVAGETLLLEADASGTVTWASDNTAVATVDQTGKVTAVTGGAVKITATVGKVSDSVDLTVKNPEAKYVTITADSKEMFIDGTLQLTAVTNDGKGTITWKSSDETVATVVDGKVTAKKAGAVTITASCEGYDDATEKLEVVLYNSRIVTANSIIKVGDVVDYADDIVTDATGYTVKWESLDPSIATITEDGKLTAVKAGTVDIVVTSDKFVTAIVEITIKDTLTVEDVTAPITLTVGDDPLTFEVKGSADIQVVSSDANVVTATYDAATGVITVEAVGAGEATITVKCGTAEDVVIEATVDEAAPTPNVELVAGETVTLTTNEDGSVTVTCGGQYKGVTYAIPTDVTASEITTVTVNITSDAQFGLQAYDITGTKFIDAYPGYGIESETTADYTYTVDPTKNVIGSLLIQSLTEGQVFTINSVTLSAEEYVTETSIQVTANDGNATVTNNVDGSATVVCAAQYKGVTYAVPSSVDTTKVVSVTVNITSDAQFGLQAYDVTGTKFVDAYPGYGIESETTADYTYTIDPTTNQISSLLIQSLQADQTFTINSVTFGLLLWEK